MSITNLENKIKTYKIFNNPIYFTILVIIFVGISCFFLGRLSVLDQEIGEKVENNSFVINPDNEQQSELNEAKKVFLASKNGKMYYTVGCSGASRIAEKNIIWFSSSQEAELAGYQFSSGCK